jgi:hypothetical protein
MWKAHGRCGLCLFAGPARRSGSIPAAESRATRRKTSGGRRAASSPCIIMRGRFCWVEEEARRKVRLLSTDCLPNSVKRKEVG